MFCPNCGTSCADGAKFCGSCGSPLPAPGAASANTTVSAPPKQPPQKQSSSKPVDIKKVAILGAAALVVIVVIVNLFGGKGGVGKDALVGRWYRQTSSSGDLREVFWFQKSGTLTLYNEAGDFTSNKGDNGSGYSVLAHWSVSGKTVKFTFADDKEMMGMSYFGGDKAEAELSDDGDVLTLHTESGPDLILQRYPD